MLALVSQEESLELYQRLNCGFTMVSCSRFFDGSGADGEHLFYLTTHGYVAPTAKKLRALPYQ
jgi:hypothetical protein